MTQQETCPLKLGWLAWEADGASGYAQVGRELRMGLMKRNVDFVNSYLRGWDALVAVCTPTAWIIGPQSAKRRDVVYHTMFEATPLPEGWVDNMNDAGLIWTPSEWCKQIFVDHGVTTPIMVSGYGVNHDIYRPISRHGREGPMKFVVWADTLISRKNVLMTIQAFIKADIKDAILEVKLREVPGIADGTFGEQFSWNGKQLDNVIMHVGSWDRHRLIQWLQDADCALYLSGGEGFGLMPLEAAATGLTSIVANNTGMLEYLNPDGYLLVNCPTKTRSVSLSAGFHVPIDIFKPDFDQVVEHIRWACNHREEMYDMGDLAAQQSMGWTWDRATELAYNGLDAYVEYARNCP